MESPTVMLGTGMMICDPRYKWYQAAQRYTGVPMHVHGLLNQLRKAVPAPMPIEDALNCMVPGYFVMGTQEAYDLYCQLYDEIKYRVDNEIGVIQDEKYRLLWSMSIPPWYGLVLFNYFETLGAVFPIELVYAPPRPVDIPSDVSDPLERMAWRFYDGFTRYYDEAQKGSGHPYVEWFLDWIKEYKLDGVVFHQAMTCRTIHTGQLDQINLLKKYSDKPVLILEGDIVDVSNYSEAATHTKIDAFIELLEDHKKAQP